MEGLNHEAVGLAGHLKLGRLIVLWDDNKITIDGSTDLSRKEDVLARYDAMGWHTVECDGMDPSRFQRRSTRRSRRTALADPCKTIIGYGAPNKQGTAATHGSPLGAEEVAAARKELGWDQPPFEIPADVAKAWREAGARGGEARSEWYVDSRPPQRRSCATGWPAISTRLAEALPRHACRQSAQGRTRKASEMALEVINAACPWTIGGSADLTGSNNTKTKALQPLTHDNYAGRYIYYGIREFGMAAAMNGMAQHGGVLPYGGTFLVFSDYAGLRSGLAR